MPKSPEPLWVQQPDAIDGKYIGVGASERQKTFDLQMARSRQLALAELSQIIQVSVDTSLSETEILSSNAETGEDVHELTVNSVTETTTNVVLTDVEILGRWLDHDECVLWTRLAVDRDRVEQIRDESVRKLRLEDIVSRSDSIEDSTLSINQRLLNADIALTTIRLLERTGEPEDRQIVAQWMGRLETIRIRLQTLSEIEAEVTGLQQQIAGLVDGDANERDAAASLLVRITALVAPGSDDMDAGDQATLQLANMAAADNNPCRARELAERVIAVSPRMSYQTQAQALLETQSCDADARQQYLWQRGFKGRALTIACAWESEDKARRWRKPCDEMAALLRSHGANVKALRLPPDEIMALVDVPSEDQIVMTASGRMVRRDSERSPMGEEVRFAGTINTLLVSDSSEVEESYTGMGGWNPVGEEMAMEVLGIHAFRRFRDLLERQLNNGELVQQP